MSEGTLRHLVRKYQPAELIDSYNAYVGEQVFPEMGIEPSIHILDCTELEVELSNENYEGSEVIKDRDKVRRGYKLASLRGLIGDTGILEEIHFGNIKQHDLLLSRDMVLNSKMLQPGDLLINDRGFISRDLLNQLKRERGVDTYLLLRKNMEAYEQTVEIARDKNQ